MIYPTLRPLSHKRQLSYDLICFLRLHFATSLSHERQQWCDKSCNTWIYCWMMEVAEAAAILLLTKFSKIEKKRKEQERSYWVLPLLCDRSQKGLFFTLYGDLRAHPDKLFLFARISISSFDDLVLRLQNCLKRNDTNSRRSISPVEKVFLTLS